jgi:hypothetical protein
MPFAPILAALPAIIGAGAGVAGAVEAGKTGGAQRKALNIQDQIAQQQLADKQKVFDQLLPFFQQYMGQGSPFLSQIQRASAEQNAQQFNNAAGTMRNQVQASGMGYGPSAATAAGVGGLGAQAAATSSSDYLTNLLNNENLKFQAAQGVQGAGNMMAGINQPNVSSQIPYTSTGSNIFGLSQALQNLLKGNNSGGRPTYMPNDTFGQPTANLPTPIVNTGSLGSTPPFLPGPTPTQGGDSFDFGG